MAIGAITPNDQGKTMQEDVVDAIYNVSYSSTPLIAAIGESVATNTLHSWLTDSYAAPALNAGIEGADVTVVDPVIPGRTSNIVQMFQKTITVSDTEQAIPHYGLNDPLEYYTMKAMRETARDMELAWVAGTRASGNSGVARQADGAIALISTNKTARSSGATLNEDEFNAQISGVYTTGSTDEEVDLILTGAYLKRAIDKFATNTTKYLDADAFRQVLRVDVYQSSFGQHRVELERNVPSTGAAGPGVLGLDTSKWRTAWLVNRRLAIKPLAKTGSAVKALLEGEATLEALNEKSSFYSSGYFVG